MSDTTQADEGLAVLATLRRSALVWFAVICSAFSLFQGLKGVLEFASFISVIVESWQRYTELAWRTVLPFDISKATAELLSLSLFLTLLAFGTRFAKFSGRVTWSRATACFFATIGMILVLAYAQVYALHSPVLYWIVISLFGLSLFVVGPSINRSTSWLLFIVSTIVFVISLMGFVVVFFDKQKMMFIQDGPVEMIAFFWFLISILLLVSINWSWDVTRRLVLVWMGVAVLSAMNFGVSYVEKL